MCCPVGELLSFGYAGAVGDMLGNDYSCPLSVVLMLRLINVYILNTHT